MALGCPAAASGESGIVNRIKYTKRHANEITIDNAGTPCTSGITKLSGLFSNSSSHQDISSSDQSAVADASNMFSGDHDFNQNVWNWIVSIVTNMHAMILHAAVFNQGIRKGVMS